MQNTLIRSTAAQIQGHQLDFILLDGSSSMQDKWLETLRAIDTFVALLKDANTNAHVILRTFCNQGLEVEQRDTPLQDWTPCASPALGAYWGMTPLYDAIHMAALSLRSLDPVRCSIIIGTDGDENASQFTTLDQAKAFLDWMRFKGWQVTFIGADFNNSKQAALLGADPASAIGVQKALLSQAAAALAKKRIEYGLYGKPMHFTPGEQSQFGGYLSKKED